MSNGNVVASGAVVVVIREILPLFCNRSVILKSITGLRYQQFAYDSPKHSSKIVESNNSDLSYCNWFAHEKHFCQMEVCLADYSKCCESIQWRLCLNNQTDIRFLLFLKTTQFLPSAEIVLFYDTRCDPWTC